MPWQALHHQKIRAHSNRKEPAQQDPVQPIPFLENQRDKNNGHEAADLVLAQITSKNQRF